jgi:hypothetical protein
MARKEESLQEGTNVLMRLKAETLPMACFHPYLHKVRGRLKVERKTDLYEIGIRIDFLEGVV